MWPAKRVVESAVRRSWDNWSIAHGLPGGVKRKGREFFDSFLVKLVVPPRPAEWEAFEVSMQKAVCSNKCILQDDNYGQKFGLHGQTKLLCPRYKAL